MKVCVFSKEDGRGGGASVVAEQLSAAFRQHGHEATHLHLRSTPHPYGRLKWGIEQLKRRDGRRGYRDHTPYELLSEVIRDIPKMFDVLHLHDTSTALSHRAAIWLAERIPTYWTLHDCSPFTAGCLYPGTCSNFETLCHACPKLSDWPLNAQVDRTKLLHERRLGALQSRIHFTAPSHWMIGQFGRAAGDRQNVSYVPNGVDLDVFHPRDIDATRDRLGMRNSSGPYILFSSGWLHDDRKGPKDARIFIEQIRHLNPTLVLVGRYSDEAAQIFNGVNAIHFGYVRADAERAQIYAACDAALMFSKQENAPLLAIESLAVGTPVFGFASGGIPEIVENARTGFLGTVGDVKQLAERFAAMYEKGFQSLRQTCAATARERHDWKIISQMYLRLFSTGGMNAERAFSQKRT